jgi:hypothetical protein
MSSPAAAACDSPGSLATSTSVWHDLRTLIRDSDSVRVSRPLPSSPPPPDPVTVNYAINLDSRPVPGRDTCQWTQYESDLRGQWL